MLDRIAAQRDRINQATFVQNVRWVPMPGAGGGTLAEAHRR